MLVPSGPFIFGYDSAESPNPKQTITLDRYYVDETEVSNDDYKRFCEATGHTPPVSADYAFHPELPVADVSLEDARAYAAWAGKRLPTEQEWEKAARGTDGRVYPWGSAPWTDDIPRVLQPVRSLESRKSPYGAQNMAGNVFEWTAARFPAGQREFADMESVLNSSSFSREWYTIKGGSFAPHGETFFRASCVGVPLRPAFTMDRISVCEGRSRSRFRRPVSISGIEIVRPMRKCLVMFFLLITALIRVTAQNPELHARDVFWSANDLVAVAPNPGAKPKASASKAVTPAPRKRVIRAADNAKVAKNQIDPSTVTSSGYGAQPHLVSLTRTGLGCAIRCCKRRVTASTGRSCRAPPSIAVIV